MSRDRYLVVGAGPIGLAMADALKQQDIPYVQVEAGDGIGGNWHHGVYETCHVVSSKRSTGFSDYPMPDDYPDFPSGAQMLAYLENFARDRGLMDAIQLNREVTWAQPNEDETWQVRFSDGAEETYKGLLICTGHHWDKIEPRFDGHFDGEILHSKDYKRPSEIAGKRVLVLGGGNSGCDLACEAARVGASCDWSLRRGYWFLPKTAFGRPLTDLPIWWLPEFAQRAVLRGLIWGLIGDYRRYGLKWPDHKLFERHPTFGSDALNYVRQGRITPRPGIDRCEGRTVYFTDGTSAEYDMIAAGTGFRYSIPFLPPGTVPTENDAVQVYGGSFVETEKNLLVVGFLQPRNGFGALITPAARLTAKLLKKQEELGQPIGAMLKWRGFKAPTTPYINPNAARRHIWLGEKMLPILKLTAKRYARHLEREAERAKAASGEADVPENDRVATAG
jgi:hypothetical protein